MVCFDLESLFTNVPIDAVVQAALQKLENDPSLADHTKGYQMVFASMHSSSSFYFASTSSDQICLASREHIRKYTIGERE